MSASITTTSVLKQIAAMCSDHCDIGVQDRNGAMLLREHLTAAQIESLLAWLRFRNARGCHIFIRPSGIHSLSLLDDLDAHAVERMRASGFEPAVVVETSPRNFQVWLNHGRILDPETSTCAAKELARMFLGDRGAADWRHFGRLAGFTNQKEKRRLNSGLMPYVKLRASGRGVYRRAEEFLGDVQKIIETKRTAIAEIYKHTVNRSGDVLPPSAFHQDRGYGGDLHRADMAWALYAVRHGLSFDQIRTELLHARDLSKKGNLRRQIDYVERTAIKAVRLSLPHG